MSVATLYLLKSQHGHKEKSFGLGSRKTEFFLLLLNPHWKCEDIFFH